MKRQQEIIAMIGGFLHSERRSESTVRDWTHSAKFGLRLSEDWSSNPGSKPRLFRVLQHTYPARYPDSMRRTFERGVAKWRALNGPGKTVFFPQDHQPGRLAASDFTNCNELGVTINRIKFDHMLFHCVLTYSNIESVSLLFFRIIRSTQSRHSKKAFGNSEGS